MAKVDGGGSVRVIREGNPATYQGIVRYKDGAGAWRTETKVLGQFRTLAAAKKALAEWRDGAAADRAAADRAGGATARTLDYCTGYVRVLADTGTVEPSTVADYTKSLRYLGALGDVRLCDLTAARIQAWELELLARPLAPVTVGKAHRVLKQCVGHAMDVGDLTADPMRGVKPPKRPKKQPNALDAKGRARLVDVLGAMDPSPLRTGVALALFLGMREGEICGLRWQDVDLAAGELSVNQAIGRADGGAYVKEPKTGGSRRTVPLTPQAADELRSARARAIEACMAAGAPFSGTLYVLGPVDGGNYSPVVLGRKWAALAEAHGFRGVTGERVTFHDLRHTFATTAIAAGVDVKTVSSMLGHANAAMTLNVYASADPDAKRLGAQRIGEAFAQPAPKTGEVIEFAAAK